MHINFKKCLAALVACAALGTLSVSGAWAEDAPKAVEAKNADQTTVIDDTFVIEGDDDTATLKLGHNLFLAGNTLQDNSRTDSLLFAAGNNLDLTTVSDYGFLAGNTIDYDGRTAKDLFIAGNIIKLSQKAEIGRDVFVAGNNITVSTDLRGDLSATGATVVLDDIDIAGNLNLSAERIVFRGNVNVKGAVVYNEDATVEGAERLKYGSLEIYEVERYETPLIAIWYAKLLSAVSLFVIMVAVIAIWKHVPTKVAAVETAGSFVKYSVIGFGVLILVPVLAILALMSYVLAPIGLLLLALYVIMIYLAQGFAGLWLGHVILHKGLKMPSNAFVEAGTGILVLAICSLVPYLSVLTGFIGLLLGLGLIIASLKGGSADQVQEATVVNPRPAATKSAKSAKNTKGAKSTSKNGGQKAKK